MSRQSPPLGLSAADEETCRGHAHVAEAKATGQNGDTEASREDTVSSGITQPAENKHENHAQVADPQATAQSGDPEARRGDALVPDVDPGSVASVVTELAENDEENYEAFLSECCRPCTVA